MMGALYEDVENFFGDIFAWYGRIVARFPWIFVLVSLLVYGLLGLGLFGLKYETRLEVLYTPIDSLAIKDRDFLQDTYPDTTGDSFYARQQISHATYGEIIVKRKNVSPNGNPDDDRVDSACAEDVLSPEVADEIWRLNDVIFNITTTVSGREYTYLDVCAMRDNQCVVDGLQFLPSQNNLSRNKRTYKGLEDHKYKPNQHEHTSDYKLLMRSVLSGISVEPDRTCSDSMRIRYNLKHNNTNHRIYSLSWEREFLKVLRDIPSDVIDVTYAASESLDIELRKHVKSDAQFLGFSVIAMIIFATIIGSGINCVTNHVTLAYAGVFAALLSALGAFGLLSLLGLRFVNLCGVMPFLVLGIGADDMFQLLTEWRQSNVRDTIEERMASTMRSTAVSITITSLTDLIAFCIGATSPFVSVRNFCACSGVAVLMCYINQLTFYSGCMVIHARRVQASRHWITCCVTKSREELEEEGANSVKLALCSGNPPRRIGEEGGICRKISRILYTYYPRFILHWITKWVVFLVFVGYLSLSVWGAVNIKKGLKLETLVPDESYLSKYLQRSLKYFPNNGATVTLMVRGPHRFTQKHILYHHKAVQDDLSLLLQKAEELPVVVNDSHSSWLEYYLKYRQRNNMSEARSEREFINGITSGFFEEYPTYKEDVKFNNDMSLISSSRLYVTCKQLNSSDEDGEMMLTMRRLANSSPLYVIAYSPDFVYYEHYVTIMRNTFLPVGVTMIGLLFVALVFIPHPIAVTCVTCAMISIVLGMVGFMHFWGLTLSAITVIQVIMSLGICVSFTVHMSHSFMTATGKNRNERVTVAIEKVGIPILNGALSSLFCAVMLSFGSSFIFTSFFKTMTLVFFLGLIHSLVFLPVMLSFIGPRRTSKPRVFIPVSPSSRSLQDTYRNNSIIPRPADTRPKTPSSHNSEQDVDPGRSRLDDRELSPIDEDRNPVQIKITDDDDIHDDPRTLRVSFDIGDSPSGSVSSLLAPEDSHKYKDTRHPTVLVVDPTQQGNTDNNGNIHSQQL